MNGKELLKQQDDVLTAKLYVWYSTGVLEVLPLLLETVTQCYYLK